MEDLDEKVKSAGTARPLFLYELLPPDYIENKSESCGVQKREELEVLLVYIGVLQNLDRDEKDIVSVSNLGGQFYIISKGCIQECRYDDIKVALPMR